jgi:hypothetical protein
MYSVVIHAQNCIAIEYIDFVYVLTHQTYYPKELRNIVGKEWIGNMLSMCHCEADTENWSGHAKISPQTHTMHEQCNDIRCRTEYVSSGDNGRYSFPVNYFLITTGTPANLIEVSLAFISLYGQAKIVSDFRKRLNSFKFIIYQTMSQSTFCSMKFL